MRADLSQVGNKSMGERMSGVVNKWGNLLPPPLQIMGELLSGGNDCPGFATDHVPSTPAYIAGVTIYLKAAGIEAGFTWHCTSQNTNMNWW